MAIFAVRIGPKDCTQGDAGLPPEMRVLPSAARAASTP